MIRTLRITTLAVPLLLALRLSTAEAGTIATAYVNDPNVVIAPGSTSVVTARVRLPKNTGDVDQMLFQPPVTSASSVSNNMGGLSSARPVAATLSYQFTLIHDVAEQGFRYLLSLPAEATKAGSGNASGYASSGSLFWNGTASTPNLTGKLGLPTSLDYNLLQIYAATSTPGASVSFSSPVFSSTPTAGGDVLSLSGSLTGESITSPTSSGVSTAQWIASASNLNLFNWKYESLVTFKLNGSLPTSGESIKFELNGKKGAFDRTSIVSAVPEPSTGLMALVGAIGLAGISYRRRRRSCPTAGRPGEQPASSSSSTGCL